MPRFHSDYAIAFGMAVYIARLRRSRQIIDVDYVDITDMPITQSSRLLPERSATYNPRACYCTVCGREFYYGDDVSPMFKDDTWKYLLSYYSIDEKARAAAVGHRYFKYLQHGHTFICAKCAEKALGRPIRIPDLMRCRFNVPFLRTYFGYTDKQAACFV